MNRWRCVGAMAFLVTSLTVASTVAAPTGTPSSRDWLRPTTHQAAAAPAPAHATLGKWVAVALLVGLSGFALWKRRQLRHSDPVAVTSQIKLGAVTRLSPKAQLIVATVNGRSMLLGVTDASVTRLMWMDAAEDDELEQSTDFGRGFSPAGSVPHTTAATLANRYERQRAGASVVSRAPAAPAATKRRQPSRFREILADAIGLAPKTAPVENSAIAPVDELLRGDEDRYLGRDSRPQAATRSGQRNARPAHLINVEGQAAGLVARLNRPVS